MKKYILFTILTLSLVSCSSSRKMESCDYLSKKMSGYNFTHKGPGFKY